jgi:hypothetical protein
MIPFEEYFHPQFKSFLKEGLIKTYPIDHLKRVLDKTDFKTAFETYVSDDVVGQGDMSKVITMVFSSKSETKNDDFIKNINSDVERLKDVINTFGFFIGHVSKHTRLGRPTKSDDNTFHYKISIEPKYPSNAMTDINNFYHVTYNRYIPKIKNIGLTPRTSKTSFSHPGNRIYLFKTNSVGKLADLMMALSDNRLSNIPDEVLKKGKTAVDVYVSLNQPSNMVVYKVNVDGLKLYEDPMVDVTPNSAAFFTTQNISPDRLTLVSG